MRDKSKGYRIFTVFNYLLLTGIAVVCLYPFYYVVVASVSNPDALVRHTGLLTHPLKEITLDGYRMVLSNQRVFSGYRNTLIVLMVGLVFNMTLTVLGAYVLSLKQLMLRKPLTLLVIFTMYFSGGLIPSYLNVQSLGMMDSLWALILPGAVNTSNLIIMRSAFFTVPDSLSEAAEMDGANHLQILVRVMLPLVRPTLAVLVLYYGVAHWNAWFNASIYLRSDSKYPLQLVLRNILINSDSQDMMADIPAAYSPQVMLLIKYALIVVSSVPILCIYPFLQRFFQKGVMIGAVKG